MSERKNVAFIDLLRIFAAFLVIVNHTNSEIFLAETPAKPVWYLSIVWFYVSKIAVPLFLMITGYLMLDRPQTWRKTFGRALRIFLVIPLFSAPYYLLNVSRGTVEAPGVWDFFKTVFSSSITTAYWYLYLYLGILLCLPFIQKMVAGCDRRDLLIYIGMAGLITAVLPLVKQFVPGMAPYSGFYLPIIGTYLLMLLLGHYFKKYPLRFRGVRWVCVAVFCFAVAGSVALSRLEFARTDGSFYLTASNREYVTVLLPAAAAFCFWATVPLGERWGKLLAFVGRLTFGIYLLSDLLIPALRPLYVTLAETAGRLPAVLVYELAIFAAGGLITWVLRLIPPLKKLL